MDDVGATFFLEVVVEEFFSFGEPAFRKGAQVIRPAVDRVAVGGDSGVVFLAQAYFMPGKGIEKEARGIEVGEDYAHLHAGVGQGEGLVAKK